MLTLDLIRTTYAKVAGKYQDVLTLESSVAELHQMFLDFALLTEQQGELLDQIEFQVKQAGDYIEDANVDVYESIQYQSSIRIRMHSLPAQISSFFVVSLHDDISFPFLRCTKKAKKRAPLFMAH